MLSIIFYAAMTYGCPPPISTSSTHGALPPWPQENLQQAQREGVALISGHDAQTGTRYIKALVTFDASVNQVMDLLRQTDRQVEYLPLLQRTTVLQKTENENTEQHEVKAGLFTVTYQMRHHWDMRTHQLWWCLNTDVKNDLRAASGYWRIYPIDAHHSIGEYGTHVDIGAAIPQVLQDFAARKDVPKALHNQRKWVNSGGTFRPHKT